MAVAKEIRTKINSIKSTQKITRAMEMVAASKMRKTQDRMRRSIPYAKKMLQVIGHLARSHTEYKHPFLQARPIKNVGMIVVSTDRGLCGGLNTNLLRRSINEMKNWKEQKIGIELCLMGTKAEAFFKRIGGNIIAQLSHYGDKPSLSDLVGVVKVMLDAYLAGQVDAVYLSSNEFINTMRQEPRIQQILPLVASEEINTRDYWDYIYEPDDAKHLLNELLKRYIESQVYRAVTENIACEQAARMLAMKNATDNAAELITDLQTIYHKVRQAAITRELSEITAGAAAV